MVEVGGLRMGTAAGRWVLATTVLGSGIVMIDGTVVNVALASIGEDLDAGFSDLQWTVNAYTLTLASLILLGGSLGDHFGRRRIFLIGVAWFAVASLACGLAGGSTGGTAQQAGARRGAPVEINFNTWYLGVTEPIVPLFKKFEDEHNIKVTMDLNAANRDMAKYTAWYVSGTAPDVVNGENFSWSQFYNSGVILEITDLLDGRIARSYGQVTSFGKLFDPFSDAFSRFTLFLGLYEIGVADLWMIVLIFYRDSSISFFRSVAAVRNVVLAARTSGKAKAIVQGVGTQVIFLLLVLKIPLVYLCLVVWWAIRAEPRDEHPASVSPVSDTPSSPPPPTAPVGARPRDVLRLIVGQGVQLVVIGILLGLVISAGMSRVLSRFLPLVDAADWITFVSVAAGLAVLALLACYVPARRATRVPVMTALRYESEPRAFHRFRAALM